MNAQGSLFDLSPVPAAAAARKRGAAAPRNRLAELRTQLGHAAGDLADAEYNLAHVDAHLRQSRAGGIDDNWIQGGVQLGAVQVEWLTDRKDGRYPIRQTRWLRHLRCHLHLEAQGIRASVAVLEQKVCELAAIVEQSAWSKVRDWPLQWAHTSGWKVTHCGHPTANWPYMLEAPDRDETIVSWNGRGFTSVDVGRKVVDAIVGGDATVTIENCNAGVARVNRYADGFPVERNADV